MTLRSVISDGGKAPLRAGMAGLWKRFNSASLTILTYHRVSDHFDRQLHQRGTWTETKYFRAQIRALTKRFSVLPLRTALDELRTGALNGHHISVTLDDGDAGLLERALPILEDLKCPATLFVNSAYTNAAHHSLHFPFVFRYLRYSQKLELSQCADEAMKEKVRVLRRTVDRAEYRRLRLEIEAYSERIEDRQSMFLTVAQLNKLPTDLFQVGLHGHVHQRFSMLSDAEQAEAIALDLATFSAMQGFCPAFAIPFGGQRDWNERTLQLCLKHGLTLLSCTGEANRALRLPVDRLLADNRDAVQLIRESWTSIP